jgi:GSCFA family
VNENIMSPKSVAADAAAVPAGAEAGRQFYRGDTANYMPNEDTMFQPRGLIDYVLKGWVPAEPFITAQSDIVAFGSCFAGNIGRHLANIGFDVSTRRKGEAYVQTIAEGLVNVHSICQQFEWAWENRVPQVELWHGWKAEDYGYDEDVRLATKALFDKADVFILTFGLSEIWYDEPTGEVFWRAVPADKFDASRHKFRLATFEETLERLRHIHTLIRKNRPDAAIIFTLSPIGLAATFRPVSCVSADAVSKAILRAAIDTLYREVHARDERFFYFPSYEIVTRGFRRSYMADLRHVQLHVLETNMKSFERYFCQTGMTDQSLLAAIETALAKDVMLLNATAEERKAFDSSIFEDWSKNKEALKVSLLAKEKTKSEKHANLLKSREERVHKRNAALAAREERQRLRAERLAAREEKR